MKGIAGAPGTIRTSDPQIRSLSQQSEKVWTFCKPTSLTAPRYQWVRTPFANQNFEVQRDGVWSFGPNDDAASPFQALGFAKRVAIVFTRGSCHYGRARA